jgi:hypothetical protein
VTVRRRSRTIPSPDAAAFGRARIRTGVVRAVLVLLAVALGGLAYLSTRGLETRSSELSPGGRSGVVVIDLSLSIVNRDYAEVRGILERLIKAGNPTGLVVFSDVAYELLPPRTPAAELKPFLRFFTLDGNRLPPNPWTPNFQAGTRISEALDLAHAMLKRDHVSPASILLISDLETAPTDYTTLGRSLRRLAASDIRLRVAGLSPSSEALNLFGGILGKQAFVDVVEPSAGDTRPLDITLHGATPFALLALSALALLALAAHELLASRLALPAGAGWRRT